MKDKTSDKRRKIMASAIHLIAENGFHASPTAQIAQNAGVGIGTLYRHFKNKDALIREIYMQIRQDMEDVIYRDDSEELPVRNRFMRILSARAKYLLAHPDTYKFLEQYHHSPYYFNKKRGMSVSDDAQFTDLLNYAKSRHIVKDMDNKILCAIAFGPIMLLFKEYLSGSVRLDGNVLSGEKMAQACWDALKL